MGTAKIIEVIDYIAVYYTLPGSRESRCELCLGGCLSLGGGGRGAGGAGTGVGGRGRGEGGVGGEGAALAIWYVVSLVTR